MPGLHKHLAAILLAIAFPMGLTLVYSLGGQVIELGWLRAVIWNTAIAFLIWRRKPYYFSQWGDGRVLLLSILIAMGAILIATASRAFSPGLDFGAVTGSDLAWVFWVPLAEEAVFRIGLGRIFTGILPGLWGNWYAALTFSLAHGSVTFDGLMRGDLGGSLGPFLLGLICQAMVTRLKSIWPGVFIHMACNCTAVVFKVIDPRWLTWLGVFYV